MDIGLLFSSLANIMQPSVILLVIMGVTGGILVGSLPGLTATMGVALLVPFTFGLPVTQSLAMLLGIYCGAMYGGSISAILIRTPGTPAAAATILDGYPLTQKGEAGRALSISLFASFTGGMTGALVMSFLSPLISRMALKFSAPEYFALAIFGLSVIISISGKSVIKGIMAGLFGLLLATIGFDPISGFPRYTFGFTDLFEGPAFIPTLIGLFALSEIFSGVERIVHLNKITAKVNQFFPTLKDLKRTWKVLVKSSLIGTFTGSIPGAGGDIAAFIAYSEAKRDSKTPEKFGTGMIEGVAASESANNSCSGGAMIPLLSLGVPGDAVTAVLLGAFIIQGLQPGPLLYRDHLDVVYNVFASMIAANLVMLVIGTVGITVFSRIITIRKEILLPVILVLSLVGAYSMRNNFFDVYLALIFGVIGFLMQRYGFPVSPILLALILGPMAESNMRRSLVISSGSPMIFLTHPICLVMLVLAVLSLVNSVRRQRKLNRKCQEEKDENE